MTNPKLSRIFSSVLCSSTIMLAAAVSAQSLQDPQAPVIVVGDAKAKKVCKSEPVVGSRFAKKVCHTPAEWQAIQQTHRVATEQYQQAPCRAGAASTGGAIQC